MNMELKPYGLPDDADTTDDVIDLLADLGAHWKRHRAMGRTPKYIRAAILGACRDVLRACDHRWSSNGKDAVCDFCCITYGAAKGKTESRE